MFATLKNKPDTQKIVGYNAAAGGQDITEWVAYPIKVIFPSKKFGQVNAEQFKTSNLYNSTQASGNDEENNLFLFYQQLSHYFANV